MRSWVVEDLGRREYAEVLALQHALVEQRQRGEIEDRLLLVEHDDVVTLGRRRDAKKNVLLPDAFPIVEVERGGDATYHGPGQLVAYPIVLLENAERDLHAYLRRLEDGIILACSDLGLPTGRSAGNTGVWTQPREGPQRKLASIGIAVRRWVAFHGLALNVSTELAKFAVMNPCGFDARVMTSLERELGRAVTLADVKPRLAARLGETLDRSSA
jgi:lipoyl(octanoyl) transferase